MYTVHGAEVAEERNPSWYSSNCLCGTRRTVTISLHRCARYSGVLESGALEVSDDAMLWRGASCEKVSCRVDTFLCLTR
jgi:hypothetical protein